ncbi:MAG: Rpn family recombination-promoting nuclease/putative transposase, partial [Lachnospiraceae bacterium]|nr:Rpn family recombination-promoting nuclease/putative transposase [Lachnospiraceae bacterium]
MAEKRKFYGMKNDYMFHAVLQKNEEVLRNLLATLLEMDEADIVSCHIENLIELGKEIEGKDCILDVKIKLNDARIINIELQVYKQTYWTNRSLLYWARAYDSIKSGQDYGMLFPTYHIGILDFTLFEEHPKFMAKYQILDAEDGFLYSDKLCIKVLDLTQLEKAKDQSETDKKILKWAGIFKAETLEELEQLARGEEVFENMVVTMKKLSEDEKIRMQCEA